MPNPNDGGAAFPATIEYPDGFGDRCIGHDPGMSLRDYFAAKAMQGFCNHLSLEDHEGPIWNPEGVAGRAYELADAMLKAREGPS